jgi:U3 small nucleolar ribonucleoprotein protein LCP5
MAIDDSTVGLLSTLTSALESATSSLPSDQFLPPSEGISLLDVKNDLLLAYLQNLIFLIIIRLRNGTDDENTSTVHDEAVTKLVELRVYLERGVRPLEGKLKYQIDKVVRAAEEAERRSSQKTSTEQKPMKKSTRTLTNGNGDASDISVSGTDESESESDDDDDDNDIGTTAALSLSVGPNPAALLRNTKPSKGDTSTTNKPGRDTSTAVYKPPRITPTAMPEPTRLRANDGGGPARKRRSHLLDEYIDEELSSAPRAQHSIGSTSTMTEHGRKSISAREAEKQRERTDYEERNFTRLPGESIAERRKAKQRGEKDGGRDMFGGEDWTGLGGLGDRVSKSVAGRAGGGGGLMERREKRRRETVDSPRGDGRDGGGMGIGESFEKRRRTMQHRADKKTRRKG